MELRLGLGLGLAWVMASVLRSTLSDQSLPDLLLLAITLGAWPSASAP